MRIDKDIVIFGGGIAGLWLLNRLRNAGYHALLLESGALGQGQSVASQGMIHGGMKYALGGALTGATAAIADMPEHWRRCIAGQGEVDLRGARILSDAYYLWPRNSLGSRLGAFLGSKLVRGKADAVPEQEWPAFFRSHVEGPLYRLRDLVLDVPSVLTLLAENQRQHIHQGGGQDLRIEHDANGRITRLVLRDGREIHARLYIATAGEGNAALLAQLRPPAIAMQKRPLQMVVLKHQHPHPLYVHCVSAKLGTTTPELTVTTHACSDGQVAWYLGGELAEAGANMQQHELLAKARSLLDELFPWCDFSRARWHSFHVNRAEAAQADGKRPDDASLAAHANLLFCWPTKLTLAPSLATRVLEHLQEQGLQPGNSPDTILSGLPFPGLARPPWEEF